MKPSREEVLRIAFEWYDSGNEDPDDFKEMIETVYEAGAESKRELADKWSEEACDVGNQLCAERAVSDKLLEALKAAQLHHTTTSMPKAIERFGSQQAASEFGRKTWFVTVPNIISEVEAMRKENKE